jgi:spore cortex biosynthesis protein YabQ
LSYELLIKATYKKRGMRMILSMSSQALVFLTTVVIGAVIGFVYDLFRVIRKIVPHANLMTSIEDMLYWIIVSLLMFYVMLNQNNGEIRIFTVMGAFLGMLLYFLTVSKLFMAVSLTIVAFIKKILLVLFEIVMTPFRLIYKMLEKPIFLCRKKLKKFRNVLKKWLHKSKNYAKIKKRKLKKDLRIILKKI